MKGIRIRCFYDHLPGKRMERILHFLKIIMLAIGVLVIIIGSWFYSKSDLIEKVPVSKDSLYLSSKEIKKSSVDVEDTIFDKSKDIIALAGIDYRYDNNAKNSDAIILAQLDHEHKKIRLISVYRDTYLKINDDLYFKANSAYNLDGPTGLLSMLNRNLDLNITDYISVDFVALQKAIDAMGGLDIELTPEEVDYVNQYNGESSIACNVDNTVLQISTETKTYHLNGSQCVSYARIRYTQGADFKRTERQRIILQKILEKSKTLNILQINDISNKVLPLITTNISETDLIKSVPALVSYELVDMTGFPFQKTTGDIDGASVVFAEDLQTNVISLHELLGETDYKPTDELRSISEYLKASTGY